MSKDQNEYERVILEGAALIYFAYYLGYDSPLAEKAELFMLGRTKLNRLQEKIMHIEGAVLLHQMINDIGYEELIETAACFAYMSFDFGDENENIPY